MKEDRRELFSQIAASVVRHYPIFPRLHPNIQEAFELEVAALLGHIHYVQQGQWNRGDVDIYLKPGREADHGVVNRISLMKEGLVAAGEPTKVVGRTVNEVLRLSTSMVRVGICDVGEYLLHRERSRRNRASILPGRAFTTLGRGDRPTTVHVSLRSFPKGRPGNLP